MKRAAAILLLVVLAMAAARPAGAQLPLQTYVEARQKFELAGHATGADRARLWAEAAALYEAALLSGPSRDEAAEAALNGAHAYKQIGNYAKATSLYTTLVNDYGSEEQLTRLEKGDPAKKVAPSPRAYGERVKVVLQAYETLAVSWVTFFDYPRAAETYAKISASRRFPVDARRGAARNALILFSALEQEREMRSEHAKLLALGPSSEEKIDADYLVAGKTQSGLAAFFQAHQTSAIGSRHLVEAAYRVATLARAAGDPSANAWFGRVLSSRDAFRAKAPVIGGKNEADQPPWAEYAADAELVLRGPKGRSGDPRRQGLSAWPARGDAGPSPTPP